MMKQDMIEHELGLCIEELAMLQSQIGGRRTYVNVLAHLVEKLDELIESVRTDKPSLEPYILALRSMIKIAHDDVENLDISRDTDWLNVFTTIKGVNRAVMAFEIGVQIMNADLESVCGALRVGTEILDKNEFLNIRRSSDRNKRMIRLLNNIGIKLNALKTPLAPDFYDFLGDTGKKIMQNLIDELQTAT